ncbi:hypothetical protein [Cryptosporangium phraense]|uniref:Uncharacterized protein n=1 Tax=Cryptosporangium phraense TaxID=2593070 RepID=A0A545AI21_9ACTN|nr:hypothetical protein [Cryptosporangium phraense]TQS40910.1 hypothetical protein FL583_32305 [Cryptosporangium phraense]
MPTAPSIEQYLQELHDDYASRINEAVAEDRDDLAWQLADAYTNEALRAQADYGLTPTLDRLPGRRPTAATIPAAA